MTKKKRPWPGEEGAVRMVEHVMTKKMTVEHKKRKKNVMIVAILDDIQAAYFTGKF